MNAFAIALIAFLTGAFLGWMGAACVLLRF